MKRPDSDGKMKHEKSSKCCKKARVQNVARKEKARNQEKNDIAGSVAS